MDRGVVLSEVGRFDLEEIEVDAPGEGEVLARIEALQMGTFATRTVVHSAAAIPIADGLPPD